MNEVYITVFGAGLILVGGWFIRHSMRTRDRVEEAKHWPSVPGEVVESEIKRPSLPSWSTRGSGSSWWVERSAWQSASCSSSAFCRGS